MREDQERLEETYLKSWAAKSRLSQGREREEEDCPLRTCWQRDRDRIIHSKAFRRLIHKTQVFVHPGNDHFRTRLTHTLEVSQISRTISRALLLNEDLTEAIALGHDLGHTPFGHAGERALSQICPGFTHNRHSLRVVEKLEREGAGLNLTYETKNGVLCHTGPELPQTLEAWVVRLSDRIAYLNHDIDDALRSGYLTWQDMPPALREQLSESSGPRIEMMVMDVVRESRGSPWVHMSAAGAALCRELRDFMFAHVYLRPDKVAEEERLGRRLIALYHYLLERPEALPAPLPDGSPEQAACDYIAGMTDNFALDMLEKLGL